MKVAIATDDGTHVAAHTGRCQGFAVYEVADGQAARLEYRENTFTAHALGQCSGDHAAGSAPGHHSHAVLVEAISDCCVLVTRGLGPRLVNDLLRVGIDTYVCAADTVADAARQLAEGRLARVQGSGCCRGHR